MAVSSSRIPSFNSNSVISAARTHRAYKPENPFKVASRAEKQFRVSRPVKVRAFGPPNALKEYKLAKVCRLARTSARAKAPRWSAPKEYKQFSLANPLAKAYRVAARSRKKVRTDLLQDATARGRAKKRVSHPPFLDRAPCVGPPRGLWRLFRICPILKPWPARKNSVWLPPA